MWKVTANGIFLTLKYRRDRAPLISGVRNYGNKLCDDPTHPVYLSDIRSSNLPEESFASDFPLALVVYLGK